MSIRSTLTKILFGVGTVIIAALAAPMAVQAADVKCVIAEFSVAIQDPAKGIGWDDLDYSKVGAQTSAEKRALDRCIKKIAAIGPVFRLPLPYMTDEGPLKWKVGVVACAVDGGGIIFSGTITAKNNVKVGLSKKVGPSHALVKRWCP